MKNIWLFTLCFAISLTAIGDNPDGIIGTWVGCNSEGEYIELHFTPTDFMACREFSLQSACIAPYTIYNDSFYYYDHLVNSHRMEQITLDDDRLRLIDSDNKVSEFRKISAISLYPINGPVDYEKDLQRIPKKHYDFMFIKRKADFYCEL